MITLYENATHLMVTADPQQLDDLSDEFKFQPNGYMFAPSYERWKVSKGREGWDGYLRPMKRLTSTSGQFLRGWKLSVIGFIEEQGWKYDARKLLAQPFAGLSWQDVPPDIIAGDFVLDDNQRTCIADWLSNAVGVNKVTVSGGKTAMFAGAAAMIKQKYPEARFLYLTPSERLVRQVTKEMTKFLPGWDIGQFGGGQRQLKAKDMVVCTVAMLNKHFITLKAHKWLNTFMAVLYDEVHHCFPAGTLVDGRPIEILRAGDIVYSVSEHTGRLEKKSITKTFKSRPACLVKVKFASGVVVSTANHPFYVVGQGYVPASHLRVGSTVMQRTSVVMPDETNVQLVQAEIRATEKVAERPCLRWSSRLLLLGAQSSSQKQVEVRGNGANQPKICFGTDEAEQPYAHSGSAFEMETVDEGLETAKARRKRKADHPTSAPCGGSWLGCGSDSQNRFESSAGLALGIQNRCGAADPENCCGSRWPGSCDRTRPGTGRQEGCFLAPARVDCVEILEFASDEEFRRVCPDGFVYNIEVEDNHNYFANGILVHNCGSKTSKKVLEEVPAYFRLGASDSMKEDDPGRSRDILGLFGPMLNDVTAAPLIDTGRIAVPHIYILDDLNWNNRFRTVAYAPLPNSKAFVLMDGRWERGVYKGPVFETDDAGVVKTRRVKTAEWDEQEADWVYVDEPIIVQGLHRVELEGQVLEIDSRWCLLERMYDRCIIQFKERNETIVEWAQHFSSLNYPTLIVCTRTLHIYILESLLKKVIDPKLVDILFGEATPKERDQTFDWFRSTPGSILITPLVKEGVSINEIRAMIVADYVSNWEVMNQIVGRALRKKHEDNAAEIVLFRDRQHPVLRRGFNNMLSQLIKIQGYRFYDPSPLSPKELQPRLL